MFTLFYSNRYEALADELLKQLATKPPSLWEVEPVIVPSVALRRRLELDVAARFGICANMQFSDLAAWLRTQISRVLGGPEQSPSPLAPEQLIWRCYRLLDPNHWSPMQAGRLGAYLRTADDTMRYELAHRIAVLFEQYLNYRPDWLAAWLENRSIFNSLGATGHAQRTANVNQVRRGDERWQAQLWRQLCAEWVSSAKPGPPSAMLWLLRAILPSLSSACDDAERLPNPLRLPPPSPHLAQWSWPSHVSLFAPSSLPPLAMLLLRALARWMEVRLYLINPCREYWYDLVATEHATDLTVASTEKKHKIGHMLLAEWGRQTQMQLHLVQELTEGAVISEASSYLENRAPTWLAAIQNAILNLHAQPLPPAPVAGARARNGIEIHRCHSLLRQLEVLHDGLLALFDEMPTLTPSDILVVLPDLASAAPLIDAVFGTTHGMNRIPYQIAGLPPSSVNPIARTLNDMLALSERELSLSDVLEWLRVDAIAAHYQIDATALEIVEAWLIAAGARRGFTPERCLSPAGKRTRHTFSDALMRLYLGYALPDHAQPVGDWLPIAGPSKQAQLLGRLSCFIDALEDFAQRCATARPAEAWRELLLATLTRFFSTQAASAQFIAQVQDALYRLTNAIGDGAAHTPISAAVVRMALIATLDAGDASDAWGGTASGGVAFTTLTGLRGLSYRVICLLGMDQGVWSGPIRTDEFNLITASGRLSDRQQRDDERNFFFDLMLAARDHFWIAYTGRSIHDNAPLPPAAPVDEFLDDLAKVLAGADAAPDVLNAARQRFIVEHPLQPFAAEYFAPHHSADKTSSLFTYDSARAEIATALARRNTPRTDANAPPFFTLPLPFEDNRRIALTDFERFWRHPARSLLRDRLGALLVRTSKSTPIPTYASAESADIEPITFDWTARAALATRLLPLLLNLSVKPTPTAPSPTEVEAEIECTIDYTINDIQRIANTLPKLPNSGIGQIACARELAALTQFAARVRQAIHNTTLCPFTLTLDPLGPEALEALEALRFHPNENDFIETVMTTTPAVPVVLEGTLHKVTPEGLVIYRYARPTAGDYLGAWLHHLVLCAAAPAGVAQRTVWLGNGQKFMLRSAGNAHQWLTELIALYRIGRCFPLRFFPKSAWALVSEGNTACHRVWTGDQQTIGEANDAYLRAALSGEEVTLDPHFTALAKAVFEPLMTHLDLAPDEP